MKSNLIKTDEYATRFPLLAKLKENNLVVLFNTKYSGTVVIPYGTRTLGEYANFLDCFSSNWEILPKGTKVELIQE